VSVWRRGPLGQNPYARTAFRVSRVGREIVRHRVVVEQLGQTMRVVRADASAHVVLGKAVTTEELNWAEKILTDPPRRLEEELIEHAAEPGPAALLRKLDRRASELMASLRAPAAKKPAFLRAHARGLAARILAVLPAVEGSFGALELELVPPFGALDES
jgi:hypothetical protein